MAGPWDRYQSGPAPHDTVGDPIIAPPDPYKQAAEGRAQQDQDIEAQRLGLAIRSDQRAEEEAAARRAKDAAEAEDRQRQLQAQETGIEDAKAQIRRVIGAASQAKELSNSWFATGFGAETAKGFGGSSAADVSALLNTIGANTAFDRLQRMREESPTGGALGAVSEIELQLLRDSIASLDQSQSDAQFRSNMDKVIESYQRVLDRLEGRDDPQTDATTNTSVPATTEDRWPGVVGEDGRPLPPSGGYGRDPQTGEWSMYGGTTDDSPDTAVADQAAFFDRIHGEMGAIGLAGHGMSLGLTDEAAGVGTAIGRALTGDFNIVDNYQLGRDAEQQRIDAARERMGWGGTAAEILGGGALGKVGGGFNQLMQAGRSVAARNAPVTRAAIQGQMARRAGVEGAAVGALGGYGYGEGLEGSTTNALLGATIGGGLGFGAQRVGNALANRSTPAVSGGEVLQAADDLRIPVIPAVTGGTTARRLTGGARQGFISDQPISSAVDAMETAGEAARNRTASQTGRVLDSEDAGNVVRQAANVYSKRTSQIGGRLYDRADRMAGNERLPLPKAVQTADNLLAELGESVEGADAQLYKDIKALRDRMAGGQFSVKGIRQTRTALREQMQERGLRGSATDRVMGEILQAATEDLYDGLSTAGKQNAANALRTANSFWQKRVETIDEVLEPILGKNAPRSGEQIVTALEGLARPRTGNASRLRRLFDAMPENEARSVAATVISRMGQPTAGAAQTGSGFSFNTFLTNWNNMSSRARAVMFPRETRQALDKLATVSAGVKQAGSAMNTSNTAGAMISQAAVSTSPFWVLEPMTAAATLGGQWVFGRLLASPRVARWIASAPRNPNARAGHVAKLGGIARAEPALANEIGVLERALRAANDNPAARLAAEERSEKQQ